MIGVIAAARRRTPASPAVTWNPADKHSDITLSGSDLVATKTTADINRIVRATLGRSHTDEGYFEIYNGEVGGGSSTSSPFRVHGLSTASAPLTAYCGSDANGWGYYEETGQKVTNGVFSAYGSSYQSNRTIGVYLKNGKVWFSRQGVWIGDPVAGTGEAFSGLNGTLYPTGCLYRVTSPAHQIIIRCASYSCIFPAPTGGLYWER